MSGSGATRPGSAPSEADDADRVADILSSRVVLAFRSFGWVASVGSGVLGVAVVLGWMIGSHALVTIRPGLAAMSPTTAAAFVLAGGSLVAARSGWRDLRHIPALLLLALSLGVLIVYAVDGHDVLSPLLVRLVADPDFGLPGHTSPATACAFFLLSLTLLSSGRSSQPVGYLALACNSVGLLIASLALLGYAYGASGLYAEWFYRTIALHTASGLFILFLACLVIDPRQGVAALLASGRPGGIATRFQILMATVIPFLMGLFLLHELRVGRLAPGLAMAILVVSATVPLVLRVLFDARILEQLDTRLRHAAADQRRLNDELEERVEARSAELLRAEGALRQSQKMEAVGELTGGLAHDFNNLLTAISGSLELVGAGIAAGQTKGLERYVSVARSAAKRAAAITHRLLAFSRRQTLDPKPTDVHRLVVGMEELLDRTMGPQVAVRSVGGTGLWPTLIDPSQLENALLNLCINARDAMPDGGTVTIGMANRCLDPGEALESDLDPGDYISLCVSDTGTGMRPEVMARAFDPFFTTKPSDQGTGLGLSMVHGFVRQSGGQVRIQSKVGVGTSLCLYLPRHLGVVPVEDAREGRPQGLRPEPGATVLVVDDEASIRMLVGEVLQRLGFQVIEAADGAAALDVLRSSARLDLLITDVGLPGGMNGRQVADAARLARPGLKVLFITGFAEGAVLDRGHLAPGMQVLTKPFELAVLETRIKQLVDDR